MQDELLFRDKTEALRRCFFEVQNGVGLGRYEEVYHQAILHWLREHQIPFESKRGHPISLAGREVHMLFPDLVVWDAITVELKAVTWRPRLSEFVQLFDYLKVRGDQLGLMVNMGLERVSVRRIVYNPKPSRIREDWSHWDRRIDDVAKSIGARVQNAMRLVYSEHGTGYGDTVSKKLIVAALAREGLSFVLAPMAKAFYDQIELSESALDCVLVENEIVVVHTSLFESNTFNINRGRSYLRNLGKRWGIAANFGKSDVQLAGFYAH